MNKITILLFVFLWNCVSLKSVSITPQPSKRDKKIDAEVRKFVFLGFNFNNEFVEELPDKLIGKCPKGTITGITTRYEIQNFFLFHFMNIKANAYCVEE